VLRGGVGGFCEFQNFTKTKKQIKKLIGYAMIPFA